MEGIIYQYDNIKTINLNEYDLIVKSINSDYDSFANLMKLHKRHLYQMAYIHTRDKDMALDIIQETTIVAFKNIKSLKEALISLNFFPSVTLFKILSPIALTASVYSKPFNTSNKLSANSSRSSLPVRLAVTLMNVLVAIYPPGGLQSCFVIII